MGWGVNYMKNSGKQDYRICWQYPCLAPKQILHLPTGDGQGYLITPDGDGYAVSGNLDGLVWRPWRDHLFKDGSLMP